MSYTMGNGICAFPNVGAPMERHSPTSVPTFRAQCRGRPMLVAPLVRIGAIISANDKSLA
eukprot:12404013-Karenia_brevis.AAC.1